MDNNLRREETECGGEEMKIRGLFEELTLRN